MKNKQNKKKSRFPSSLLLQILYFPCSFQAVFLLAVLKAVLKKKSARDRRISQLHGLDNEEVARVDSSVICAYNSVDCCFAEKASNEGERREVERVAISE
jgi:hypothetical protein